MIKDLKKLYVYLKKAGFEKESEYLDYLLKEARNPVEDIDSLIAQQAPMVSTPRFLDIELSCLRRPYLLGKRISISEDQVNQLLSSKLMASYGIVGLVDSEKIRLIEPVSGDGSKLPKEKAFEALNLAKKNLSLAKTMFASHPYIQNKVKEGAYQILIDFVMCAISKLSSGQGLLFPHDSSTGGDDGSLDIDPEEYEGSGIDEL